MPFGSLRAEHSARVTLKGCIVYCPTWRSRGLLRACLLWLGQGRFRLLAGAALRPGGAGLQERPAGPCAWRAPARASALGPSSAAGPAGRSVAAPLKRRRAEAVPAVPHGRGHLPLRNRPRVGPGPAVAADAPAAAAAVVPAHEDCEAPAAEHAATLGGPAWRGLRGRPHSLLAGGRSLGLQLLGRLAALAKRTQALAVERGRGRLVEIRPAGPLHRRPEALSERCVAAQHHRADLRLAPSVQLQAPHEANVHAVAAVPARAREADGDAEAHARPLGPLGAAVKAHVVASHIAYRLLLQRRQHVLENGRSPGDWLLGSSSVAWRATRCAPQAIVTYHVPAGRASQAGSGSLLGEP
mmetsp:Transcript_54947/g.176205  ORF Transcript_54947/g.176205 Transcript_54947/m.176205 type:complete len:355 (+) Transcript_54947:277-1341(+)